MCSSSAASGILADSCDLSRETRLGNARSGNLVRVFSVAQEDRRPPGRQQAWQNAHSAAPASVRRAAKKTGTPTWRPVRTWLSPTPTGTPLACLSRRRRNFLVRGSAVSAVRSPSPPPASPPPRRRPSRRAVTGTCSWSGGPSRTSRPCWPRGSRSSASAALLSTARTTAAARSSGRPAGPELAQSLGDAPLRHPPERLQDDAVAHLAGAVLPFHERD